MADMAEPDFEPARAPRPVRTNAISIMSAKLLEGYAMLADSCPDCGVPLLRKPGSDPLCVNCTATTAPHGPTVGPTESGSPEQHQAPKRWKETAAGNAATGSTAAGAAPAASHPAAVADGNSSPAAVAAAASNEVEEGLLEAPPSLSSLLRKAEAASPAGPATAAGAPPGEIGISAWRPPGQAGAAAGAAGAASPGSSRDDGVDVSQLLADKLLQGWALLEQHCPRCETPLVRNRQRQLYCVSCSMFAVREGDVQQQPQQAQQQAQQAEPSPAALVGSVAGGRASAGALVAVPAQPLQAGSAGGASDRGSLKGLSPAAAAFDTPVAGGTAPAALLQRLDAAAGVVGARLQQASAELAAADSQQSLLLVQLIQGCAEALSSLHECRRKLGAK